METIDLVNLNIVELKQMLTNKSKAIIDLSYWLSANPQADSTYAKVMQDKRKLEAEVHAIEKELEKRDKPFKRSLNNSFEL